MYVLSLRLLYKGLLPTLSMCNSFFFLALSVHLLLCQCQSESFRQDRACRLLLKLYLLKSNIQA